MASLYKSSTKVSKLYYKNVEVKKCYYQGQLVLDNSFPYLLGDYITWDSKPWLICHLDLANNSVYLMHRYIIDRCYFDPNIGTYSGSYLAIIAKNYESNFSSNALSKIKYTTVEGVTAKVFVPSKDQLNGGFSWFATRSNRIAQWEPGSDYSWAAAYYWTSTGSGRVGNGYYGWYVINTGDFNGGYMNSMCGFRPCICVDTSAF